MTPALTLLVLGKGDIILISGVQYPKDWIQVGAVEQIGPFHTPLLGDLQLLQLLDQKLSGILWRTETNHCYQGAHIIVF